jgi:hypothetical protein
MVLFPILNTSWVFEKLATIWKRNWRNNKDITNWNRKIDSLLCGARTCEKKKAKSLQRYFCSCHPLFWLLGQMFTSLYLWLWTRFNLWFCGWRSNREWFDCYVHNSAIDHWTSEQMEGWWCSLDVNHEIWTKVWLCKNWSCRPLRGSRP